MGFSHFDAQFSFFSSMFMLMFVLVFIVIAVQIVRGLTTWNRNNQSPILDVEAKVVAKRINISTSMHHSGNNDMHHHSSSSSTHYVTFEVNSGDRMELQVKDMDYGMMVEGDSGVLQFQGTRFLQFTRHRNKS